MTPKIGDQIKCQGTHKLDPFGNFGCYTCGGAGAIAEWRKACSKCGKEAWFRSGVYTSFDGKEIRSLDGLELIHIASGLLCLECQ